MRIVTLISDFGLKDHYVGLFKGVLLSQYSMLNIVDINHHIHNFDIVHTAFVLKNCYYEFPKGTIHIINVKTFHEGNNHFIAIRRNDHFFIAPNNGILSLAFDEEVNEAYQLDLEEKSIMGIKHSIARAVAHIANEKPFKEIGTLIQDVEKRISLQPVVSHGQLRGNIIHIDNFGNAILNIDRLLFNQVCGGREFSIFFKRTEPIKIISQQYSDVPIGEALCLFNSSNHLEIALNMDNVAEKHGLKLDDAVIIKLE